MGSTTAAPTTHSTTPSGPDFPCNGDGEINAYPGNCHWYYRCSDPDGDGTYDTQVFDCGDDVFDPNMGSTTAAPTTHHSTTPSGPDFPCNGDGEINAYPGNCHWYYRCSDPDGDGTYD